MAEIALSRDFLGAYARLPRKAQRKVDELLIKFRQDSTAAAIHVEPIHRTIDPMLRSARIGDDYRVILRAPERGDVYIALWADHHDEAYRWALNKQAAVHPATGTLQIFDVEAASRALTLDDTESAIDGAPIVSAPPIAHGAAPIRWLFAAHADDSLFTAGVPRALLPSVRAVATEEDLERLVPHLPPEAGEVLTGLAAGLSLDEALEEVLGRPTPPSGAPEPPRVDTADLKSALEREATQRQFFLLTDALDLDSALRHPLDTWRVFLHPKQRRLTRARTQGPMRVLGAAGTGKTVVALHRAAFLVREVYTKPDDRVLFTTFTVNLAHDLRTQLAKLLGPDDLARVEVINIDRWASEYLRRQGESFQQAFDEDQRNLMSQVHDVYGPEGFDLDFCRAEWHQVVQEQDLRTEEAYVKAVRRHRGVPLSRNQRRMLWPVFAEYRQMLGDAKRLEPLDVIRRARQKLEAAGDGSRYRAAVVDETQDFSAEALRLVRAIVGPEHLDDVFLVGDAHQRIYGRAVALSACGISVRGRRSQTLRINYRTTAAISRFAFGALHGVAVDDLDEGQADTRGTVSLRDGPEPVLRSFELPQDEEAAVVSAVRAALDRGLPPEAIAVVARTKHLLEQQFGPVLADAGIETVLIEQEEPRRSAVRLATLHRVKGLEFPVVIIAGASSHMLPYPSPELNSEDPIVREQALLRERCLLYVAASRARDELHVFSHGTPSPLLSVLPRPLRQSEPPRRTPTSRPPKPELIDEKGAPENPATQTSVATRTFYAPTESSVAKDTPLDTLLLPARMKTFIDRRGLETVRELGVISPQSLLEERNMGRGTIAKTRALLEPLLGTDWETFATGSDPAVSNTAAAADLSLNAAGAMGNWDAVRHLLTPEQRATPIREIVLPARVRSYVERENIMTLREVAARSHADLIATPNFGRTTAKEIGRAVAEHFERLGSDEDLFRSGLLEGFKTLLQELEPMERIIVSRRSGLAGAETTLEELGELFGVTRERIRQIQSRACDSLALRIGWAAVTRQKILSSTVAGAIPLDSLVSEPWWSAAVAYPAVIDFIADEVLSLEIRTITVAERVWISPWTRQHVEGVTGTLRARVLSLPLPAPLAAIHALVQEVAGPLGAALAHALGEEVFATLHVEQTPDGGERVVGVGATRRAEVLAILRSSTEPMRIEDLYARIGVRTGLPEEVINFDRGLVGLKQHFSNYEGRQAELVPAVRELMHQLGPDRQWTTSELLDELRESHDLPDSFNAYWLGALLRDAPGIRYLGRNRVALADSFSSQSRIYIHEALEKLLQTAGSPVPRHTLIEQLEAQLGASEFALAQVFGRPQFVRLGEDQIGLRARDVPGGESAISEATDLIAATLLRRDVGLSAWQAHNEVQTLSATHENWPRDLTLSLLRNDERLRLNQGGSVGLATWESTRVPTRLALLRAALASSDGNVSVDALAARFEAHFGEPPTRGVLASLANQLDAALDGEWIRARRHGGST